jgi:hypothetical protein
LRQAGTQCRAGRYSVQRRQAGQSRQVRGSRKAGSQGKTGRYRDRSDQVVRHAEQSRQTGRHAAHFR